MITVNNADVFPIGCAAPTCPDCGAEMSVTAQRGGDTLCECADGCEARALLRHTAHGAEVVHVERPRAQPPAAPAIVQRTRIVRTPEYRPDGLVSRMVEDHIVYNQPTTGPTAHARAGQHVQQRGDAARPAARAQGRRIGFR